MKVPPVPTPTPGMSGLGIWANNIVSYLRTLARFIEQPGPKAIQLEHKRPEASAVENGVLMWDNVLGLPVISKDGQWWTFLLGQGDTSLSMIWKGVWAAGTYLPGWVTRDGAWTMIALVETDTRPAPQKVGVPEWLSGLGDNPSFTTTNNVASTVFAGQRYFTEVGFTMSALRMWIHDVSPTYYYRVRLIVEPGTDSETTDFGVWRRGSDIALGWYEGGLTPERIVWAGSTYDLVLEVQDRGNFTDSSPYNWLLLTPNNDTIPNVGEVIEANRGTRAKFHKLDSGGTDRTSVLTSLDTNDEIIAGGTARRLLSSPVVVGDTVEFDLEGSPDDWGNDGSYAFTFRSYALQTTSYANISNYWTGNASVSGYIQLNNLDTANVQLNDDAYGVDVSGQQWSVSGDWDLVAVEL